MSSVPNPNEAYPKICTRAELTGSPVARSVTRPDMVPVPCAPAVPATITSAIAAIQRALGRLPGERVVCIQPPELVACNRVMGGGPPSEGTVHYALRVRTQGLEGVTLGALAVSIRNAQQYVYNCPRVSCASMPCSGTYSTGETLRSPAYSKHIVPTRLAPSGEGRARRLPAERHTHDSMAMLKTKLPVAGGVGRAVGVGALVAGASFQNPATVRTSSDVAQQRGSGQCAR